MAERISLLPMLILILALLVPVLAGCQVPASPPSSRPSNQVVPAIAPDTVPRWVFDPDSVAEDPEVTTGRYLRDVVLIMFRMDATQQQRQEAIDHVGGAVIGGQRLASGNGIYWIRISAGGRAAPLMTAVRRLRALPQVHTAVPRYLVSAPGAANRDSE
jgi:hypothetical protein